MRAIDRARTKLGARYVLATAGPETFDCSGFTWWVAQPIIGPLDYELRSSHHQFKVWGEPVPDWERMPLGALLFFDSMGVAVFGNRASHVGLYLGDGEMIHAANEDDGVIISRPFEGWYGPRFIGARRIFSESPAKNITRNITGQLAEKGLPLVAAMGEIVTRNQWNGDAFPVEWSQLLPWVGDINRAAQEQDLDARVIAALGLMETQFTQERNGHVLTIWDDFPQDGPSMGIMQVKPGVWGWLRPDLNPAEPADNIRLGAAVIRYLIDEQGGDLEAAVRRWYPGKDIERYLATFWGLMGEMGYAS